MSPTVAPAEPTATIFDLVPAASAGQEFQTYLAEEEKRIRWQKLDGVVRRGMEVFVEVGRALAAIKAEGLFSHEFPSWDAYCDARLDCGKRTADRLIKAAQVVDGLGVFARSPSNEAQARELGRLKSAEERQQVWEAVVDENEIITATVIKQAVDLHLGNVVEEHEPAPDDNTDRDCDSVEDESDTFENLADEDDPQDSGPANEADDEQTEAVAFVLADGTEVFESSWVDGVFTRERMTTLLDDIARSTEDREKASKIQWFAAVAASSLNAEVPSTADRKTFENLSVALEKLRQVAVELSV